MEQAYNLILKRAGQELPVTLDSVVATHTPVKGESLKFNEMNILNMLKYSHLDSLGDKGILLFMGEYKVVKVRNDVFRDNENPDENLRDRLISRVSVTAEMVRPDWKMSAGKLRPCKY